MKGFLAKDSEVIPIEYTRETESCYFTLNKTGMEVRNNKKTTWDAFFITEKEAVEYIYKELYYNVESAKNTLKNKVEKLENFKIKYKHYE